MTPWTDRRFAIRHRFEHGLFVRELLAGNDDGQASGTVVYVHGLGESGLCFERLVADGRLARWRHLVPDLPGYGKSSWPADPEPLRQVAERLHAWLEETVSEPMTLVGHSMGGVLGQLFCEQFPDTVRAFVNIEGNLSPEDGTFSAQAGAYELSEYLAEGHERLLATLHRQGVDDPIVAAYVASIRMCDPRAYHLHSRELVAAGAAENLAGRMAALKISSLYVLGAPRGICPRSRVLLEEAHLEPAVFENAGHWPFLDHPQAFARRFAEFLDTHASA